MVFPFLENLKEAVRFRSRWVHQFPSLIRPATGRAAFAEEPCAEASAIPVDPVRLLPRYDAAMRCYSGPRAAFCAVVTRGLSGELIAARPGRRRALGEGIL
jgi:hypothetical protein